MESAKSRLEQENSKNSKKISELRKQLEQLKKKLDEVRRAISRLKEIISIIDAELAALRAALSSVKEAKATLEVMKSNYDNTFSMSRGRFEVAREHTVNALAEAQEILYCFSRMNLNTYMGHFSISSPDVLSILSGEINHSVVMIRCECTDVRYDVDRFGRNIQDNITRETREYVHNSADTCEGVCYEWDTYSLELKNAYYRAKNYLDQRIS